MAWKLDGSLVTTGKGFVYTESDGNKYTSPKNWHMAWDDTQKKKVGLVFEEPPAMTDENKLEELRRVRHHFIRQTDEFALSDRNLSDAMKTYRQALRDITKNYKNVDDVVWPEKPDA